MVTSALPRGISPELAAAAYDTLGGALSVASQIPHSVAAATLVLTAQDGLTTALHVTSAIGAVTSIAMAIGVAVYLGAHERGSDRERSSHTVVDVDRWLDRGAARQ